MKKKLICLLTIFSLFLTFFAFTPISLKAAEENPVISSNQAVDTSSSQLVDGTGYFKKTDTSTKYEFYYTNYLGTDVDYKTNTSLYVRTINRSVTPDDWYNSSYGLDLDNFESVSIINGKWALPHEYAKDVKGVIIPESTGYLEESIYSDCRRYVYYLVYVNEDGVQRPKFDKHYECNVEIDDIPEYLLNNGKNEKMGIQEGKIYNTSLVTFEAVRKVEYYVDTEMFITEYWDFVNTDKIAGELKEKYEWRPIVYFNLIDVDYDYLLSVKYSYEYAEYKQSFIGFFKGEYDKLVEGSEKTVEDEVFNDEYINYNSTSDGPLFVSDNLSDLLLGSFVKDYKDSLKRKENYLYTIQTKFLSHGSWSFKNISYRNEDGKLVTGNTTYRNKIVGHPYSDNHKKMFRLLSNDNSVLFSEIVYCYDGIIYASDDNVPIIGENQTPDPPSSADLWSTLIEDIMEQLGKGGGIIIDSVGKGFSTALVSFWNNLSPTTKNIIIVVIVIIILSITSFFWLPMLQGLFIKDDRVLDQSFRMYNNQSYNRNENRRNRRYRRQLKNDRRYNQSIFKRNKKEKLNDREFISGRVDKKYQHEEYLANKKAEGYSVKHEHNNYTVTHKLADKKEGKEVKKKPDWYDEYYEKEKQKFKKKDTSSSSESLEDLENFFKKQK